MSLVTKILEAAMRSREHVFVQYSPHINGISVQALPSNTEYDGNPYTVVLIPTKTVYLNWEGADEKLADLLAMIEELG